jgi:hypothetical protein
VRNKTTLGFDEWQRQVWPAIWHELVGFYYEDIEAAKADPDDPQKALWASTAKRSVAEYEQHHDDYAYEAWIGEYAEGLNPEPTGPLADLEEFFWSEVDPSTGRWRMMKCEDDTEHAVFYSLRKAPKWMVDFHVEKREELGYV